MGQHKNNIQIEIFIKFMEQHTDLARGFVKGDRVHFEQLWAELANELNASGPPKKKVSAWKKVWTDMKLSVKQRLAHNKVEVHKTGGGRFNKYILSPSDDQVAVICGLYASVDGIENAKSYGVPNKENQPKKSGYLLTSNGSRTTSMPSSHEAIVIESPIQLSQSERPAFRSSTPTTTARVRSHQQQKKQVTNEEKQLKTNENIPTTSTCLQATPTPMSPSHEAMIVEPPIQLLSQIERPASRSSTPTTSARVRNRKRKRQVADVGDVMEMEAEHFSKMSANLEKIKYEIKENRRILKELSRNVRELKVLKEKELKELTRHNYVLEKCMQTKNELKLQFLDLERMKLGMQAPPSNI